ncbi:hypothetical protein EEX84_01755 [Planococcus salinus]|uniref:Uncharacterized protein n=1 Tax=Planococcus salinus TaxID=1848460 RepID=A0A3M8PBV7_9BACL|nr:hypothetical protein EEX84_01755 [Planococcus salinus]
MAYDPENLAAGAGQRKAQAPVQSRQALEDLRVMAFFAMACKFEATRGARRRSLDNKKSAGGH